MNKITKTVSDFMDINEFCEQTGWSKNTAYKYLKDIPEIRKYHFGRFLRLDREEVTRWINSQTV